MTANTGMSKQGVKYGSFIIHDEHADWSGDANISVKIVNSSQVAHREGVWNPLQGEFRDRYETAITGMCIWGKHDCIFHFEPNGKGNGGAKRSLSNVKDREDILNRINKGQRIEKIRISRDPFGLYQMQMVRWQSEVVSRFGIKKLYYSLPIEEYDVILDSIDEHLPGMMSSKLRKILYRHNDMLLRLVEAYIDAEVEFIYPIRQNPELTVADSYMWPYKNLDIDIGIEEMEEIRIPYQAMQEGARVPPILLGILGFQSPYYEQRDRHAQRDLLWETYSREAAGPGGALMAQIA